MRHPWVILLDIDGTMLTVDRGFNRAMLRELLDEHSINYPDMENDAFSGRTDHDIFTSFLVNHDYDENLYHTFKSAYLSELENRLNETLVHRHKYVDDAINYFTDNNFVNGLLTGNYPEAAQLKLNAGKIDYDFSIGAFGEKDRDRNRLPMIAIDQVREQMGIEPDPSLFVIIGDTPRDILCAKHAGMRCISVTTGKYGRDELAKHDPDFIIDDLSEPEKWFAELTSG
ncbi:HAD family hydrolase [Gracilimonas sp. Q87]|uniref:HAD family hydrolase n=1 Tax=Gracilimonas sp. Q87 TaxID=3384766 RepID=UPI0039845E26